MVNDGVNGKVNHMVNDRRQPSSERMVHRITQNDEMCSANNLKNQISKVFLFKAVKPQN